MLYKLQLPNSKKVLDVDIPFEPYENIFSFQDANLGGIETYQSTVSLSNDVSVVNGHSIVIKLDDNVDLGYAEFTLPVEPNNNYLVTMYTLNDGILSTGIVAKDQSCWNSDFFLTRQGIVVNSENDTELKIVVSVRQPVSMSPTMNVDGFFAVKLKEGEEDMAIGDLMEKYSYVKGAKLSPTAYELLHYKYSLSPYAYYLTHNGARISRYKEQLVNLGIQEGDLLVTHFQQTSEQVFTSLIHCKEIMVLLNNDYTRVSHVFPDLKLSGMNASMFPRIQFFGGFEVSSVRADGKPFANNMTMAINIYTPNHKVRNNMNDEILNVLVTRELGKLGYSAVRGSDYNLQEEKLYIRQTQYVKDTYVLGARKK